MDKPKFVYVTYINTSAEKLWEALTKSEFTSRYWGGTTMESDWKVGQPLIMRRGGQITDEQTVLQYDPPRLLAPSACARRPGALPERACWRS